jgi:protein-disulfide isomerase/uncharacterized membrane protein
MQNKTLTTNGLTMPQTINVLLSLGMIFVSVYLTSHFYDAYFPSGIESASDSLCSGTGFWGCNKATTSALGHILYIPTSFFGIIIGLIGIIGAIFPSEKMEANNKLIIFVNALGCVGLLLYSLIVLSGLCQFCTVYYLLSFGCAYLYYKYSEVSAKPDPALSGFYALLIILPGIYMNSYFEGKQEKQNSLSTQYVQQFESLESLGDPVFESPYKINKATENFNEAPVRISIFSDFQCPFCQSVAKQIPELLKGFEDKINIQYYFYPLDMNCNPKVKRNMHPYACKASYLAACDTEKFHKIHDIIFERQNKLSSENLDLWQKEFGLTNCFDNNNIKDMIQRTMNAGDQYNLKSTPTIIINGKKIEGSIPTIHLRAIIKSLVDNE